MRRSHRRVRLGPTGIRPHSNRSSHGAQGARAGRRPRILPSPGAGEVGDRAVCSTDSRPTPIETPIPEQHPFPPHRIIPREILRVEQQPPHPKNRLLFSVSPCLCGAGSYEGIGAETATETNTYAATRLGPDPTAGSPPAVPHAPPHRLCAASPHEKCTCPPRACAHQSTPRAH